MTKIRKIRRMPAAIENVPKVVKNAMNALPAASASSRASALSVWISSPSELATGSSNATTSVERRAPATSPPRFDTAMSFHLAVAVEEPLRLVERHEQDRVGGAGSVEPGDVSHARGDGRPADVNDDPVSGHHAELAGGLRVQVHLARAQVGERQRVPGRPPDRREPVHPGRVPGEEDDARLVLTDVWSLDRDLLDNGPGDAVDEPGSRRRRLDARDGGLADPAGAGRGAERPRDVVGGALRRDRLVGCP